MRPRVRRDTATLPCVSTSGHKKNRAKQSCSFTIRPYVHSSGSCCRLNGYCRQYRTYTGTYRDKLAVVSTARLSDLLHRSYLPKQQSPVSSLIRALTNASIVYYDYPSMSTKIFTVFHNFPLSFLTYHAISIFPHKFRLIIQKQGGVPRHPPRLLTFPERSQAVRILPHPR